MRDFVAHVRRHLSRQDVAEDRYDEVVDELASELEARYTLLVQRGASDEDAWTPCSHRSPRGRHWLSTSPQPAVGTAAAESNAVAAAQAPSDRSLAAGSDALGLRVLRKDRGFTVTAIVTLAICLGGHAAIVAGVNTVLFHPLRTPEPDRVLLMANQYPGMEARRGFTELDAGLPRQAPPCHGLRRASVLQLLWRVDRERRRGHTRARYGGHTIAVPSPARDSAIRARLHRGRRHAGQ